MAGITLAQAEAQLTQWLGVLDTIAQSGQQHTILGRSFTNADLSEVQRQVTYWERKVKRLSSGRGGMRVTRPSPRIG